MTRCGTITRMMKGRRGGCRVDVLIVGTAVHLWMEKESRRGEWPKILDAQGRSFGPMRCEYLL
jgi:hypothetical protein